MSRLLCLLIVTIIVAPCFADTLIVNSDGSGDYTTIQAAIDGVNDLDEIILTDGTYIGPGNTDIDFLGKAITLRSENGPDYCAIDCDGSESENHRGFIFQSGESKDSILSGFTIIGGYINDTPALGGAVYCVNSSPVIDNCIIIGNTVQGRAGDPNNLLNGGDAYGGAIYCSQYANPSITNCAIWNNTALGGNGADSDIQPGGVGGYAAGGAIFADSTCRLIIKNCTIEINEAIAGQGGKYNGSVSPDGSALGGAVSASGSISNSILWGNIVSTSNNLACGGAINGVDDLTIVNCVIAENQALSQHAAGSAVFAQNGQTAVKNSTITDNSGTGFCYTVETSLSAFLTLTDSILWYNVNDYDNLSLSFYCLASYCCFPEAADAYGNINSDPLLIPGPEGDYYLSHNEAGQPSDSPCIDAGSDSATTFGLDIYSTRTDAMPDSGTVDMGCHFISDTENICGRIDLLADGFISIYDILVFCDHWMRDDCSPANQWCNGSDFGKDGNADLFDSGIISFCWLTEDDQPPTPDPANWLILPYVHVDIPDAVSMSAEIAYDKWWDQDGIQYYFECDDDTYSSDWQTQRNYTAMNLEYLTEYGFRVKTRDKSGNETQFSGWAYATTGIENIPPQPDPAQWATVEHDGVDGRPRPSSATSINMQAYESTDDSGYVEYKFICTSGPGHDSEWQTSTYYEDTELSENQTYEYSVMARDMWNNETTPSDPSMVMLDTQPPTPKDLGWDVEPHIINLAYPANPPGYYHHMKVQEATDENGVEYYIKCHDVSSFSRDWTSQPGTNPYGNPIPPNEYYVYVGSATARYYYSAQARDMAQPIPNYTDWTDMVQAK